MALTSIPGFYEGYVGARKRNEETELNDVRQAHTLMQIIGQQQERQAKQAALQEDQATKAALAESGGDATKAMQILLTRGAHGPAARLAPLVESQRKANAPQAGQSIGSGGLRLADGTIVPPAARPETPKTATPTTLARLLEERNALPPEHPNRAAYENAIRKESEIARQIAPTVVVPPAPPPVQTFTDGKGRLWERERGGKWSLAQGIDTDGGEFAQPGNITGVPKGASAGRPLTPYGKLNADLKSGAITPQQFNDEIARMGSGSKASEDIVKAISDGRMAMPTGFALKSPYWQDVMERVSKVNPQFDAGIYGARASARRTFASGPEARNVTAMNTLIGHLGTLDEAMEALENKDLRLYNAVQNRMRKELGDDRIANFETAKKAVASEAMRVFRQVGASTQEMQDWEAAISSAGSPAQMRGTIKTLGELLEKRIEAVGQQYERTVTGSGNPGAVDPKNRTLLDKLKGGGATGGWSIRPR